MPGPDLLNREKENEDQCNQSYKPVREQHDQLAVPAVHQRAGKRTQEHLRDLAYEGCHRQKGCRAGLFGKVPNHRKLHDAAAKNG